MLNKSAILLSISALVLALSSARGDINGSDDFNDNIKDRERWNIDRDTTGGGLLLETDQRLQYTSNAGSASTYWPWALNQATYNTNWEVILDLTNAAVPVGNGASASIGIEVFAANASNNISAFMGHYAEANSTTTLRGFETGLLNYNALSGTTDATTSSTSGAIRITFNASTKVLTFYRDADGPANGYAWTLQASYGIAGSGGTTSNTSWGLTGSDEMSVQIYGYSSVSATAAGAVYADNFQASTGTSAATTTPTNITNNSAVLTGNVSPGGLDTSVVFQWSTDEQFLEAEQTDPQIIPGTASNTKVTQIVNDFTPATPYWVRIRATNSLGTFVGNTVFFGTPPYTLTVNSTTGTVNTAPLLPSYPMQGEVTLTAVPPAGRTFVSWSDDVTSKENPLKITITANTRITANFSVPIEEAANAPTLSFTTGGSKPWFGQGVTSHDGVSSVQSGAIGDNQQSWFQTTITGPGVLTFWRKISSDTTDNFELYIDNQRQLDYTGGIIDWTKMTYNLAAGSHTVRWQYTKDIFAFTAGQDAVWIDEITFTPPGLNFAVWKSSKFTPAEMQDPLISGDNADPDGDGVNNLLEFALGGQPKDPASRVLPVTQVETIDGLKYLTLTVTKPTGLTGITYTPKVSPDLTTWLSGSANVTTITDTATTLKVRDNVPMSSSGKRFIRLNVISN